MPCLHQRLIPASSQVSQGPRAGSGRSERVGRRLPVTPPNAQTGGAAPGCLLPYPAPGPRGTDVEGLLLPRKCSLSSETPALMRRDPPLCTAASPCTLHMNGCLKLLQQPARGDPSPPALPRRSSFLLCTPGVLRGPRHPQPCSPQPAGPPDAPRGGVGPWPARLSCQQSCFSHVGTSSHKSGLLF